MSKAMSSAQGAWTSTLGRAAHDRNRLRHARDEWANCHRSREGMSTGLKTLLMTGYAEALRNNGMSEIPVLRKPFKAVELSRRIAEILNELAFDDGAQGCNTLH